MKTYKVNFQNIQGICNKPLVSRSQRKIFLAALVLSFGFAFLTSSISSTVSSSVVTTVIDFESLSSSGEIVRNQFASKGVIFQPVLGVDYSQDGPIPAFAHSGAKALEVCRGVEFCRSKLDISFTTGQRRVKIWTGFTGALDDNPLEMRLVLPPTLSDRAIKLLRFRSRWKLWSPRRSSLG
jgi:hypothetical protein